MVDHISVCVCTYKRPEMLEELLKALLVQKTNNLFLYSIVVVDNDSDATAKIAVEKIKATSDISISYKEMHLHCEFTNRKFSIF